jgi:uncharacterized protein YmfQ (DUF2313 family)
MLKDFSTIKEYTIEDCINFYISNLPHGLAWNSKHNKTSFLYAIIYAKAKLLYGRLNKMRDFFNELNPTTTINLINDWELLCGLPDVNLPPPVTIDERRMQVISRLVARKLITLQDFKDLLNTLKLPFIDIYHINSDNSLYNQKFPFRFPIWFLSDLQAKLGVIVELYENESLNKFIVALLNKLKPVGVMFYYVYKNP